jgi:hypothetical protein
MGVFLKQRLRILPGLVVVVAVSVATANHPAVVIHDPWIPEAPPSTEILAAYMTMKNTGDESLVVTSVSSQAFKHVEIHKSEIHEGMARMVHEENLVIPAHGQIEFKPGGYHFMLIGSKQSLRAGDKVDLTLIFSNRSELSITAEVRKNMGYDAMDHSVMEHGQTQ